MLAPSPVPVGMRVSRGQCGEFLNVSFFFFLNIRECSILFLFDGL